MYIKKKTKLKIKLQQMILIYRQTVGYICKKKKQQHKIILFIQNYDPVGFFFKESAFFVQT